MDGGHDRQLTFVELPANVGIIVFVEEEGYFCFDLCCGRNSRFTKQTRMYKLCLRRLCKFFLTLVYLSLRNQVEKAISVVEYKK